MNYNASYLADYRVSRDSHDSAVVVGGTHEHEAVVAPVAAPRVLHQPVRQRGPVRQQQITVPHQQN